MSGYRHLFFDLDHTLWDFEKNSRETLLDLYDAYRLHAHGVEAGVFVDKYFEINAVMWRRYHSDEIDRTTLRRIRFEKTFDHFNIRSGKVRGEFPEAYLALLPEKKNLLPGSVEILGFLRRSYTLHLITNGFASVQENKLRVSGLAPFFAEVIISEQTGFKKPERGIFEVAAARAGADKEHCLMIGDDVEADIAGAANAGWDAVYFNPGRHTPPPGATYVIQRLEQLREIL